MSGCCGCSHCDDDDDDDDDALSVFVAIVVPTGRRRLVPSASIVDRSFLLRLPSLSWLGLALASAQDEVGFVWGGSWSSIPDDDDDDDDDGWFASKAEMAVGECCNWSRR